MSRYQKIPADQPTNENPSYQLNNVRSFELDKEKEAFPYESKFKRWCIVLICLTAVFPVSAWFVEEQRILFYQSLGFFIGEVCLSLLGLRATSQNVARRLDSYTKYIHLYFLSLLACLIVNEAILTYTVTSHNDSNCGDFTFNKVCDGRWGLMSDQLILILFYPVFDMIVFIIYRYFLQTTEDLKTVLNNRDV